jgi:hypothetical protein
MVVVIISFVQSIIVAIPTPRTVLLCNLKGHVRIQGYLEGGIIFFWTIFLQCIIR